MDIFVLGKSIFKLLQHFFYTKLLLCKIIKYFKIYAFFNIVVSNIYFSDLRKKNIRWRTRFESTWLINYPAGIKGKISIHINISIQQKSLRLKGDEQLIVKTKSQSIDFVFKFTQKLMTFIFAKKKTCLIIPILLFKYKKDCLWLVKCKIERKRKIITL